MAMLCRLKEFGVIEVAYALVDFQHVGLEGMHRDGKVQKGGELRHQRRVEHSSLKAHSRDVGKGLIKEGEVLGGVGWFWRLFSPTAGY